MTCTPGFFVSLPRPCNQFLQPIKTGLTGLDMTGKWVVKTNTVDTRWWQHHYSFHTLVLVLVLRTASCAFTVQKLALLSISY